MLGLLDSTYICGARFFGGRKVDSKTPEVMTNGDGNCVNFCFVPRFVAHSRLKDFYVPKSGKSFVYTTHSFGLVNSDPYETLDNLREVYADAQNRLNGELENSVERVNFLGISLGNIFSTRLASEVPEGKLGNFGSIAGGGRLGESAWDSHLTGPVVRSSGLSKKEYERVMDEFSPVNYARFLEPSSLFARFAGKDLLIPSVHGRELLREFQLSNTPDKDLKVLPLVDHCWTILFSKNQVRDWNKLK